VSPTPQAFGSDGCCDVRLHCYYRSGRRAQRLKGSASFFREGPCHYPCTLLQQIQQTREATLRSAEEPVAVVAPRRSDPNTPSQDSPTRSGKRAACRYANCSLHLLSPLSLSPSSSLPRTPFLCLFLSFLTRGYETASHDNTACRSVKYMFIHSL
jgi:hypothetical protein